MFQRKKTQIAPVEENETRMELMRHMQEQVQQVRAENQRLLRDMEAIRDQMLSLEKREVAERMVMHQKVDSILKSLEGGAHIKSPEEQNDANPIVMANGSLMTGSIARAAAIYCKGPLLEAVQTLRIFPDSKSFVDMPMKDDPEKIEAEFSNMSREEMQDPAKLREFVDQWFRPPGDDFDRWSPPDFKAEPPLLMQIRNPEMRDWSLAINRLWPTLGIIHKQEVHEFPHRHSALPRKHGMVVPGGRFREMYYWDTYWVVRGLIVCDMVETARGIVLDLVNMVGEIGFVPNGGRIYYLDRSQPPLLTAMVKEIYNVTKDAARLATVLPVLEKEYSFWMNPKSGRRVELPRLGGSRERQYLNIYRSMRDTPRPESYVEDADTFKEAQALGRAPADVYRALSSGAESGWDFSTRWLEDGTARVDVGTANLATIDTCRVIPVDLNAILYDVEMTLAYFHREVEGGENTAAQKYEAAAKQRQRTMDAWLWAGDTFRDYRLDVGGHSSVVAVSDYAAPLWAGLTGPKGSEVLVNSLKRSGLLALCGASTTTSDSGGRTQWDAPNAWSPMNSMLIDGLDRLDGTKALADCLCETWLRNNFITWQRTGFMHEKYDCFQPGRFGAGGEYEPQVGFGWTNGTALCLLVRQPRVANKASYKMVTKNAAPAGRASERRMSSAMPSSRNAMARQIS